MGVATRVELVTVCSDRYLPGALVALQSFTERFRGFASYPLTVLHAPDAAPLSDHGRRAISTVAPQARYAKVSQAKYVTAACPTPSHRAAFLTLEIFRPRDVDKVFFFDCDTLCVGDCSGILAIDHDFIACRAETGYSEVSGPHPWCPINTGFISIGRRWMRGDVYAGLLDLIDQRHDVDFADQAVVNQYFRAQSVYLLPDTYNFRHWGGVNRWGHPMGSDALFRSLRPSIKVIHYSGYLKRPKPWSATADTSLAAIAEWRAFAGRCAEDHPSLGSILAPVFGCDVPGVIRQSKDDRDSSPKSGGREHARTS